VYERLKNGESFGQLITKQGGSSDIAKKPANDKLKGGNSLETHQAITINEKTNLANRKHPEKH